MSTQDRSSERDGGLLIAYPTEENDRMSEAVIHAFLAANVDVFEKETRLHEWINTDALDNLLWDDDRPIQLRVSVWHHMVEITPEEVRIYVE